MNNGAVTLPQDTSDKLVEARKRKQKRDKDRLAAAEARELAELEAEEKYEAEGKKRGVDFEIVNTEIGVFVVKNPDFVVAKNFLAQEKTDIEDVVKFVAPCLLEPSGDAFRAVVMSHGGVVNRIAKAALTLFNGGQVAAAGKF